MRSSSTTMSLRTSAPARTTMEIASLEVDHCYAVLTWCWDSDDDTSILLETYVNSDKADEAVLDESKDDDAAFVSFCAASPQVTLSHPSRLFGRLFSFLHLSSKRKDRENLAPTSRKIAIFEARSAKKIHSFLCRFPSPPLSCGRI